MKPLNPHDPLDDLIAAALHGELTPEERTQFESRLTTDPAAQAAYLEAQAMHDLLEKTHQEAQPDPAFEQRMVSGVRRKLQTEQHRETAWESLLALWKGLKSIFGGRSLWTYGGICSVVLLLAFTFLVYSGNQVKGVFTTISRQLAMASASGTDDQNGYGNGTEVYLRGSVRNVGEILTPRQAEQQQEAQAFAMKDKEQTAVSQLDDMQKAQDQAQQMPSGFSHAAREAASRIDYGAPIANAAAKTENYSGMPADADKSIVAESATAAAPRAQPVDSNPDLAVINAPGAPTSTTTVTANPPAAPDAAPSDNGGATPVTAPTAQGNYVGEGSSSQLGGIVSNAAPAPVDNRKLIRNAQLDLQVKSYQTAMDQITALTKAAGGYVDTSNSQKGGNGKLQGTVVVKVLPQNLDAFLLKLRDLGEVQNQSVSTDDVTKDYYDTQARLDNSRRMETQLQELLKHVNGKVSDLLEVERELGRVRGDIEQMQGQLKLYDFQVQYATVTMNLSEKDLNQAAAYLLKEQDDFSLFATDVEDTFQQARKTADDFKAQVLTANLNHNSGSDVSAELTVMVPPDQIEAFLTQVRGLGRVANFTRQTQRVAQDGGDSSQPADETKTEKDKVQVHLAIRSDDETRKQVALTVVAKAVDSALDQAKTAALANAGGEILGSSLNKTPQGQSTAQLSLRVPGKDYAAVIAALEGLGRTASLSIQRNDDSGPGANGDDAPVIISLSLTDDDTPLQETEMSVVASDVDAQAQQIKKNAADAGVEVKASSFERQPDGTELAQMTFRLPMAKYPAFLESVEALGKVESLSVRRDDRPDQTVTDDTAPAEISLQLHNQRDIVADNNGLWTTLRQTFGDGAGALFGSIRVIGVLLAFLAPWVFTLVLFAWIGRRIYIWRKR